MIAFDKDRRLDIIGKPLYGRISFFQKDTNQLDKIYIYDENDQLVLCENPVYTDINGFLEYDVILENKFYTVHQEKYIASVMNIKKWKNFLLLVRCLRGKLNQY